MLGLGGELFVPPFNLRLLLIDEAIDPVYGRVDRSRGGEVRDDLIARIFEPPAPLLSMAPEHQARFRDVLRGLACETSFGYALGLELDAELILLHLQPTLDCLIAYADRIEAALVEQGWTVIDDRSVHVGRVDPQPVNRADHGAWQQPGRHVGRRLEL